MPHSIQAPEDPAALALANTIYEIGRLALQSAELEEVIHAINRRIIAETSADYVGVALLDEHSQRIVHTWGNLRDGTVVDGSYSQTLGEGLVGRAAQQREVIRVDDTEQDPRYVELVPRMRSEVAVPLELGGRVIGVLDVESRAPGNFRSRDVALLQAVSHAIAQAIELTRMLQENRRRQAQLELLNELARVATGASDLDALLPRVVEAIRERLGVSFVAIGLLTDDDRVELRALSSDGDTDLQVGHCQRIGEGVTGEVVSRGESLLVSDVRERENHVSVHSSLRCELCCPLRVGGRTIGFLDLEHEQPGGLTEADRLLIETIAEQLGQIVDNARNLRRIERLRDELSGMFVHDLRNPLSVVQSTLDMLVRELGPPTASAAVAAAAASSATDKEDRPPRHRRWVRAAQGSVNEMLVMIDGLLQLQRLENRALVVDCHECDLAALAERVVEQLRVIARPTSVEVEARISADLPRARLDENLVQRILQNLGMNAVKFTGAGGHVTLGAEPAAASLIRERLGHERPCLLLSVQDTGPGIPASEHERIFDKFAVLKSRQAGYKFSTGLGLAFCRRAAEAHDGAIWVESQLGEGSTFRVLLPADDG